MSYIKLHRKLLYSECFKKPEHLKLWIYCLLRANHEDKVITHGGKLVKVLRGSFITGRHKMSEDTGISERKIRTFLESKKATKDLSIESTKQYSVITVCNYSDYQDDDALTDQQSDQQNSHKQENKRSLDSIKLVRFPRKSDGPGDPEFEIWWKNWRDSVSAPPGAKAKGLRHYKGCRMTFSVEEINVATRNYLLECRKFSYPNKHAEGFLNPKNGLIEQYQSEQTINQPKEKHESLLDQEYQRLSRSTASTHGGS
jgi:hypothetical protein